MPPKSPISELDSHVGFWLRLVSNQVSQSFARRVEAEGVTVAEWVLMRQMLQAGPTNPSLLADQLGMTRGAISKLVDRLCRKKLAQRSAAGSDARYQQVALTAAGKKLTPKLAQLADDNDRAFFGHWTEKQRRDVMQTLQALAAWHGWKEAPTQ